MMYLALICLLVGGEPSAASKFSDVDIEKQFERYLLASPLLMSVPGAKVSRLSKQRLLIVAVASTVLKDNSPRERLQAEKVCRATAFVYLVQQRQGVQVFHTEESREKTVVVNVDGKEHGKNVSELLEITTTRVSGIAKILPVIGRWKSKEGDVFYLALGGIVNERGELVEADAP